MRTVLALMNRNRKLFFKDKGMLFTSMITPVILIVLYATFLAKVFRDSFTAAIPDMIRALRAEGVQKTVMMTGDSEKTAAAVARRVGVDEYYAEVLPEEKAGFVEREKAQGHKVIMIGDGINDSPALSAADAGIAISDGAELAREIADITIAAEDLAELVVLKRLANGMTKRIGKNYHQIIGINAGLIVSGIAGVLQPTTSALLHNTSTLLISLRSMRNLLTDRNE